MINIVHDLKNIQCKAISLDVILIHNNNIGVMDWKFCRKYFFYLLTGTTLCIKSVSLIAQGTTPFLPKNAAIGTSQTLFADESHVSVQLMKADFSSAPTLKWNVVTSYMFDWTAPTIGDVDGDGSNEVLFVNEDYFTSALDGATGAVLWTSTIYQNGGSVATIADATGDGIIDVVVGGLQDSYSNAGGVSCLNGSTGAVIWEYNLYLNYSFGGPLVTDVDNNGTMEVIMRLDADLVCLNGADGTVKWTISLPCNFQAHSNPAAKDIDCDGIKEIFIYGNAQYVYSINGATGAINWQYFSSSAGAGPGYEPSVVVADIDNDCVDEVVFVDNGHAVVVLNAITGVQEATSGWNFSAFENSTPAVANINNDVFMEVIMMNTGMAMGSSPAIFALDHTLTTQLWSTTLNSGDEWPNLFATPTVGEFSAANLGYEVFVVTAKNMYLLSAATGAILWSVPVMSDGYAIGDIDNDGCVEIVLGNTTLKAYDFNGSSNCGIANPPVSMNLILADSVSCGCFNFSSQTTCASSWEWSFPNATPSSSNLENPGVVCFNYSGTHTVQLIINPGGACTDTVTKDIIAYPCGLTVDLQAVDNSLCDNECTDLSAVASMGTQPYSFTWSHGLPSTAGPHHVCPLTTTTYYVTVTDADTTAIDSLIVTVNPKPTFTISYNDLTCNGVCDGTGLINHISGTAPYIYTWNNPQTTNPITGLCAGTYYVTVTDFNTCFALDTFEIIEPLLISFQLEHTDVLCHGDSTGTAYVLNSSGGTGTLSYLWSYQNQTDDSLNSIPAGTYTVSVTDENSCTESGSVVVLEPTAISVSTTSITSAVCGNASGSTTVEASGGTPGFTYAWPENNGPTITNVIAGNYIVTVTDTHSCTNVYSVNIPFDPGNMSIEIESTDDHCNQGNGRAIAIVSNGDLPIQYQWNCAGGNTPSVTNLFEGDYSVSVTDNNGCHAMADFNIENIAGPVANFITSPQTSILEVGQNIHFYDISTGSITDWLWNFDNNNDGSNIQNPQYSYPNPGEYTIYLLVTDEWGCIDTATKNISIREGMTFYIPTAFSPNGDGINDYFGPYGTSIDLDNFEIRIFDRWGEELFVSRNINSLWNGSYNGVRVETGVYVWSIFLKGSGANETVLHGRVTVLP